MKPIHKTLTMNTPNYTDLPLIKLEEKIIAVSAKDFR